MKEESGVKIPRVYKVSVARIGGECKLQVSDSQYHGVGCDKIVVVDFV